MSPGTDGGADEERRKAYFREVAQLCETQLRDAETATTALKELLVLDVSDDGARSTLKRLLEKAQHWDELALVMAQEAEQEDDVEARISLEKALAKLHEQKRKDPVATGEAWARIAGLAAGDDEAINTAVGYFEKAERPGADVSIVLYNADGSISEISGNGTRCVAALLVYQGAASGPDVRIQTGAGLKDLRLLGRSGRHFEFEMNMGRPAAENLHAVLPLAAGPPAGACFAPPGMESGKWRVHGWNAGIGSAAWRSGIVREQASARPEACTRPRGTGGAQAARNSASQRRSCWPRLPWQRCSCPWQCRGSPG